MRNVADVIERFILGELFEDQKEFIDVQRRDLAKQLECAPSQITYTLTTRFTPERGYEVISKRGNGGYIRIVRLQAPVEMVEPPLLPQGMSAENMVDTLYTHKMITKREWNLLMYNLEILGAQASQERLCMFVREAYERLSEGK